MPGADLEAWAADLDDSVVTDAFVGVAVRRPAARSKAAAWMRAKDPWRATAGGSRLAVLAGRGGAPSDDDLEKRLATIEARIHRAPNRVRDAMNGALLAIGARPRLRS